MQTNHPEITKPRLASGLATQHLLNTNHPDWLGHCSKPLPSLVSSPKPSSAAIPVVFIGSPKAIEAIKTSRIAHTNPLRCITADDDPEALQWGAIHSKPVTVLADNEQSVESVKALATELVRCGASSIIAIRLSGQVITHYSQEVGVAQ